MKAIHGASFALLAGALALGSAVARADQTPAPDYTLTPKLAIYSEYEYRGIAQSSENPAVQFNLDYAHKSGFYLGTF
ncbi:MAG TPA: TorF family putative porin, partial [Usitatibacter sp.]|nr:TorF family putative porin [Usitatibacter sp.]